MANKKLSELAEKAALPLDSLIHILDPNDLSDSPEGSDFKFKVNKIVETNTSLQTKRPIKTIEGNILEGNGNVQLINKEDVSKKQNNLDFDGTGNKYPTVDGVNDAISKIKEDKNFIYNQTNPSAVWNVTHNLEKRPTTTVVDTAGSHVVGQIDYINENEVIITFGASFSGYAYFN
jgi:hypothetical protein